VQTQRDDVRSGTDCYLSNSLHESWNIN
jgi:hypothetical protein